MASIILDLTLTRWDALAGEWTWEETHPDTPDREATIAHILAEAKVEAVKVKVLNENGPAGGNPEVEFTGDYENIKRIVEWAIAGMGESDSWADEYWTDRSPDPPPAEPEPELGMTTQADCCGTLRMHAMDDGFDLVRVGLVVVCGHCLLEAGVVEDILRAGVSVLEGRDD